jgi:alpha-L-fucosidase 2
MKRSIVFSIVILAAFQSLSQTIKDAGALKLWYNNPASNWNEALPIGNGRLGAMVFGNPLKE